MRATIDERRGHTSASNAEADALCPGRHLAQAMIPEKELEQDSDAERGRKIHEALALRDPSKLTLEEAETYERCLQIESKKLEEFFQGEQYERWSEDPANPETSRLWVKFKDGGQEYEHSCRPDCFFRSRSKALVEEFKTLLGDVPVSSRNLQLRDQQVMIRGHFLITGDIGTVVIQPLVTMDPQICVYSAVDSDRARREMFARVIASNDPASPRVAGEVQCKFCRAKSTCAAYQQWSSALVPMVVPSVLNALDVPMVNWTPEQRATVLDAVKPCEDFIDQVKEFMKQGLAQDPSFVPGWALAPGRMRETIENPQACFDRFSALGGKLDQFMGCITVGKLKLKDAVNQVTGARGKALDNAMKTLTEGIVAAKQDAPSLKKVTGAK